MCDVVEIVFPLEAGGAVPADHRYLLHSALKAQAPLRELGWTFLPIKGTRQGALLELDRREDHELVIRSPREHVGHAESLDDVLRIGNHLMVLGEPTVRAVPLGGFLSSECVLITTDRDSAGVRDDAEYGAQVGKRLGAMLGHPRFGVDVGRKTPVQISGTRCWGRYVKVTNLNDDEKVLLIEQGLGQKRAIGCGVFCAQ